MSMYGDPSYCEDCTPSWPCWRHKRRKMTKAEAEALLLHTQEQLRDEEEYYLKKQLDNDPEK